MSIDTLIDDVRENGFCLIEDVVPEDRCAEIRERSAGSQVAVGRRFAANIREILDDLKRFTLFRAALIALWPLHVWRPRARTGHKE